MATAQADRDHTVHVDAGGLEPDTTYYYRFAAAASALAGRAAPRRCPAPARARCASRSARARSTTPASSTRTPRIAEHDDLDFLLHLGDYIYEASNTPPKSQTPGADIGRPFDPLDECRTLADYRRRYAQYRGDPDVQRLHLRCR